MIFLFLFFKIFNVKLLLDNEDNKQPHIKYHLQTKIFPLSTEREQSHVKTSLASPHRDSPISFQAGPPLLQTGLEINDSPFGSRFLDSIQATIFPTHYNWNGYCLVQLYMHIHSWKVFLITHGLILAFCKRLWNISSAKVVSFFVNYFYA